MAAALGLGAVHYKDEAERFGLGSFKALGGAYAVMRLLADRLGTTPAELRAGRSREQAADVTVTSATAGNHGRSVAWGAKMAGCRCRIYVHAAVPESRARAIEALGAEVVRLSGTYDDAVRVCAGESATNGWLVVSDTSYENYLQVPRLVMAGYTTLAAEALEQAPEPVTHLFVQAGVGGLAAALAARFWMEMGAGRPTLVIVESEHAACLMASARRGRASATKVRHESVMGGMNAGTPSLIAWEIVRRAASHFVTVPDAPVGAALRMLASGDAGGGAVTAGECSAAGVLALMGAACTPEIRDAMGLDDRARVLLIGTEGPTNGVLQNGAEGGNGGR
jgi:diaminopropionate ammonia-lyase